MSSLAQLYLARGDSVSGSDKGESPTTNLLEGKGVKVFYGQRVPNVPSDADLVVYSDAVAESNVERSAAREMRKSQSSYFEALGRALKGYRVIAVAGTHGKTTTTGMLAKILIDAGKSPTVIVGSLVKDFGSNFVQGTSDWCVVEACEYRDHLLELNPEILVITNIEWDHTDWFKSEADMRATFQKAVERVPEGGKVIDGAVYSGEPAYELKLIGEFNRDNARAAAAAARQAFPDISAVQIAQSLASFSGSWRRFEYVGLLNGAPVYDDYAHHPTAIRETIAGVREKFPGKKIIVVFQPHLYSRTRDLFDDFTQSLATADEIVLAPIYAAREVDDGSVSSTQLARAVSVINPHTASLETFDEIEQYVRSRVDASYVVVVMGAGNIYTLAHKIATL